MQGTFFWSISEAKSHTIEQLKTLTQHTCLTIGFCYFCQNPLKKNKFKNV